MCVFLSKCVCVCLDAYRKYDAAQLMMKGRRCQGDSESERVTRRGGGGTAEQVFHDVG